jgi:tRNA pseudouridine13 synthase
MKLKVKPEDFIVREKTVIEIHESPGDFRVYRLRKTQWDSFDLVDILSRRFRMLKSDISMCGRKDRHGQAEQLLAVRNRPDLPAHIDEPGYSLQALGYTDRKLSAAAIAGNHFRMTLRDISPREIDAIKQNCLTVRTDGFVNYFDEQRFGSARAGKGFPGKSLFLGRMEEALKIFLAPDGHESAAERAFKKEAAGLWRQWKKIASPVPHKYAAVMRVLNEPGGYMAFNKAVNAINRDLLIMALHAYQSFLFNRLAVRYLLGLEKTGTIGQLEARAFDYGELLFCSSLPAGVLPGLRQAVLPVPGHDTVISDPVVLEALTAVLAEENITLNDLKVKKLHGKAVRGTERKLIVLPEEFAFDEPAADELHPGQKKFTLRFYLPRGSYATMLVKRIAGTMPVGGRTRF